MVQHRSPRDKAGRSRRPIAVIVAIALIAALAIGGGVVWSWRARHGRALAQCESARNGLIAETDALRKAVESSSSVMSVSPSSLEDAGVLATARAEVQSSRQLIDRTAGDDYACSGEMTADELDSRTVAIAEAADRARKQTKTLPVEAAAVRRSTANKSNEAVRYTLRAAVSQAKELLSDTSGKVTDDSTRVRLKRLADAADRQLTDDETISDGAEYRRSIDGLNAAMDAVTTSNIAKLGVDCAKAKCVALTFDDGPDATNTPPVIRALQETGTVATFFSVGQHIDERTAPMLRQLRDSGHPIENHTWDHPHLRTLSRSDVASQLTRTSALVEKTVGAYPSMIRPPYSEWSNDVRDQAVAMNSSIINFDVMGFDWEKDAKGVHDAVLQWTRPGDIVLLHDLQGSTAQAVKGIIDDLKAEGFTFVTIEQLLGERPKPGYVYYSRTQVVRPGESWRPSTYFAEQW
ncbi:polysaccharide deacetylase family protein [Bifidobacterium margollesii]|uniref:Polysaccharide deacetylase family protein n=1 Tax=Bifidobacterium margollesii TaxID=2020964 RepID=A0A2N5JBC7_9BIFI|nr:polysaccharide deacetylase family protein [Bifidobacterium margollesii]PLS31505.1 polysaccharide deacetylase family protein [Bifidobacterium margollesii]